MGRALALGASTHHGGSGRTGQRLRAQMTTEDDEDGEDNDLASTGSGLIWWGGVFRGSHPGRLLMASDTVCCVSLGRVFIRSAPHFWDRVLEGLLAFVLKQKQKATNGLRGERLSDGVHGEP